MKEKRTHTSVFHIMISRGVGQVRSFSLSPFFIFVSFVFFALFIVASVFVINDYFEKLRTNKFQLVKLERLQKQLKNTRRLLFASEQRLALMEGYVHNAKPGIEISRKPVQSEKTEPLPVEPADEIRSDEGFQ